jgi:hypothetical protein
MDTHSESLPNVAFESAQTGNGTPTNEVVGNAAKRGTSKTIFNPCMSDEIIKSPIKRKVGRPKIHKNHAATQRAYRRRQKIKAARAIRQAGQLKIVPLYHNEANAMVAAHHRHHKPIQSARFSIGASKEGKLVGAAICARPACRSLDDKTTIEVCRLVTDGTDNACSMLYSACAQIARIMGYERIQTYLLMSESGISLKATGWVLEEINCGGTPQGKRTNRPNGHEITPITFEKKQRWAKLL